MARFPVSSSLTRLEGWYKTVGGTEELAAHKGLGENALIKGAP